MTTPLTCDQAIFTSIRTPMGEGYRIIAASRGLRPNEKQSITRNSPSHDSLCIAETDSDAAGGAGSAFYALPSGRLCVAYSCPAGAEHTGRGGLRVYTHNAILKEEDFGRCGYNPFAILRAMVEAGLTQPQLKPAQVLPELELVIPDTDVMSRQANAGLALPSRWRTFCLRKLLDHEGLIVDLPDDWAELCEALLVGLPGPDRANLSFSVGLRFSVNRCHVLSLTHDTEHQIKKRIAGRDIRYVAPSDDPEPEATPGEWVSFVDRHWESGDLLTLSRRTSLAFTDTSVAGLESVGRLYNDLDRIEQTSTSELLTVVVQRLPEPQQEVEAAIAAEFVVKTQQVLLDRLSHGPWAEAKQHFDTLIAIWRKSDEGCLFAWPLIEKTLEAAGREHPTVAADAALGLPSSPVSDAARASYARCVEGVLTELADWAESADDDSLGSLPALCTRWHAVRPQCPIVERIRQRCDALAAVQAGASPRSA